MPKNTMQMFVQGLEVFAGSRYTDNHPCFLLMLNLAVQVVCLPKSALKEKFAGCTTLLDIFGAAGR